LTCGHSYEVFASAQPRPPHAAAIEDMSEGTLDEFAAPTHGLSPNPGFQPRPVGVDGSLGRLVAMPAEIALGRFGFGDARLPHAAVERLQLLAGMIAFVGGESAGLIWGWRQPDRAEIALGDFEGKRQRGRIALIGRMDRRGHDDARVEIDRVLWLSRPDASFRPSSS
jgi:hypothetical protein